MKKKPEQNAILTPSYWKRTEPRDKGDFPNGNKIAQAVGYALSNWERMDQEMATLFITVAGPSEPIANHAVRRAYGSIESNTGRRKAIAEAAEVHFAVHWKNDAVRSSLTRLLETIGRASQRRDDIAHGIIWDQIAIRHDDERGRVEYGAFLLPPEYNSGRTHAFGDDGRKSFLLFEMTKYRYTSADINDIGRKFLQLGVCVSDYANLILKRDGKIPLVESILAEQAEQKRR